MIRSWIVLALLLLSTAPARAAGLSIHFVDVEGGAATLIVTPAGESVLIDCGNPGTRDPDRIHQAALNAGLKQIDHLVITHWHSDHYGGVARLAQLLPIKKFYDHGIPDTLSEDPKNFPIMIQAYQQAAGTNRTVLKPGDDLPLKQTAGQPPLRLFCLCGDGKVIADAKGAPENPIAKEHKPKAEDKSDNARSLGFLLGVGDFRFLDLGDLTWNIEYQLVHPTDKIGKIDVYQSTHHGLDISNNPVLVQTVQPRVGIVNNSARKGGHASVIATLRRVPGLEAIYQVHRNVTVGDAENTDPDRIANRDEKCQGEPIKVEVAEDGKSYTVTVGNGGKSWKHMTRGGK